MEEAASEAPVQSRRSPAKLLTSLRRAQLFRIAIAYLVAAWLVIQVAATIAPAFDAPPWLLRIVVLLAAAGFVATIALAAITLRPDAQSESAAKRRRFWRFLIVGAMLAAVITAATYLTRGSSFLFGERKISLAVLPFADLSPGRDKAYFAEGIAEEILSSLAAEPGIEVLGRTSARQIERNPDPEAVRASLGVTHLLEGSTRTAGNQLRVNVRLIDTSNGAQLWEEEYHGRLADVFSVQDRIAGTVVRRLRGTVLGGAAREGKPAPIDAYESYLAARALMRDPKKEPLERARKLAQQIVDSHPDYALGHALLSEATALLADSPFTYGDIPADRARRIAVAHARQAIRLAPDRADGFSALGLALPSEEAVAPLKKAISLDRSWAALRLRLGLALNGLNRHEEAFEQYRLAVETDPLSPAINNRYIFALAAAGQHQEALKAASQYFQRGGSEAQTWRFKGNVLGLTSDLSGSLAARRRALALDPQLPYQHEWLAIGLHLLGLSDQAARYSPRVSRYFQLFVADDRGALRAQVVSDGTKAWSANGVDSAIFSLARARDWPAILRIHELRPPNGRDLCKADPRRAVFIAMALRASSRAEESRRLLGCQQRSIAAQIKMSHRSPDSYAGELEMWQASLLALRNDGGAFVWLDKAVDRAWMGQYYSSQLADWPQFDGLRGDPRYAAVQRRVDRMIAKERAEALAGR